MENQRLDYLDSWRGIAALSVVIFHCMISFPIFSTANYDGVYANSIVKFITESPLKLFWAGKEPVLLFFVLSGFVLSLSFYKNNSFSYSRFVLRRLIRIYIPYIIVMAVSVVLVTLLLSENNIKGLSNIFENRWDHQVTLKSLLAYLLMINYDTANVNGVVWTLYHEIRISIIFPILMFIILKFSKYKSMAINIGLVGTTYVVLHVLGSIDFLSLGYILIDLRESAFYTIFFLMGAYLAKYRNQLVNFMSSKNKGLMILATIVSILLIHNRWLVNIMPILINEFTDLLSGVGIMLLFTITLSSRFFQKVLCSKPLLFLGKISFSLYLIHIIVLMLLAISLGSLLGYELAIMITIPLSIPIAWITYIFIEQPCTKLSRKLKVNVVKSEYKKDTKAISA